MSRCIIFCAGEMDHLALPLEKQDILIAADGGLRHTAALGLTPDVILGDFDSLGYVPKNATVFPAEKDDTDAMLAIRHGLSLGCREFILYGSLDGDRLDHTLANIQALHFLANHGCTGYLVGLRNILTAIQPGEILRFPASCTGILSLFCLSTAASGICLEGVQYPMHNGTLTSDFPLGVSNHFLGKKATVCLSGGCLTLLWDRSNGFPRRISDF